MSMICCLCQVSEEKLDDLMKNPEDIEALLFEAESGCEPGCKGEEIDLDKAWHGIHYLLTGSDWEGDEPLCYLVKGGQVIGSVDVGYGPARGLTSEQVNHFWEALAVIELEEFKSHYNAGNMMDLDIYPTIWDRDPEEDDGLGYLVEYLDMLKIFVKNASAKKCCLIIYLC